LVNLVENRYGKSRVRLVKVTRHEGHHHLYEWMVEVLLEGDFDSAHRTGDNSKLLPTDTMKNTVYYVARESKAKCIEVFARELADFLLGRNEQVSAVMVNVESVLWKRLNVDGKPHPDTFMRGSNERQTTSLRLEQGNMVTLTSGFSDLVVMKTAKSGFEGYIKDSLTTLKETSDRLLGTAVTAEWTYTEAAASAAIPGEPIDFNGLRDSIREAMLTTFAGHESLSVQQTLFAMGESALDATIAIEEVHLVMPNKHCILVDLSRFGQENPNEIFVPTDEPHGTIEARLRRG
jgi:urate oxidase